MNLLLDDHHLRSYLIDGKRSGPRRPPERLATTGCWYFRLCSAVARPDVRGRLSGPIADLPDDLRSGVLASLVTLPDHLELRSLRELGWHAADLGRRHGLNLLASEALAAAIDLDAAIAIAPRHRSDALRTAARHEGVRLVD